MPDERQRIKKEFIKRHGGRIKLSQLGGTMLTPFEDVVPDDLLLEFILDRVMIYDLDCLGVMAHTPPEYIVNALNTLINAETLKATAKNSLENAETLDPTTKQKLSDNITKLEKITKECRKSIREWKKMKFENALLSTLIIDVAESLGIT